MIESNNAKELVSVIIPVYNRMNTIIRAVNSVLNQTYENIEIIIVDDGSTDKTLEILESLNNKKINIFKQTHKGANAARNYGIKKANGKYIAFQDSDDEWLPEKLEYQIKYMIENQYEVCYCPFLLYQQKEQCIIPEDYKNKDKYEKNLLSILQTKNVVSTQTMVIHRNVIFDVGMFDEEMPRCQDYEYIIRIIQNIKVGYINKVLVLVYRTENSISNDRKKEAEAKIKLLNKHESFFRIEDVIKKKIKDYLNCNEDEKWMYKIESMNHYLTTHLKKSKINTYEVALAVLWDEYKLQNNSLKDEYRARIKRLRTKKFAIYGAGEIGKKIYNELYNKGLEAKCFLISNKVTQNENYGIPVIQLTDLKDKDMEIIVGVSFKLQMELINNLITNGYTNYIRYWN